MPKIPVSDLPLYYESHGEGAPLVLIPGLGGGLWLWFKQIPDLSNRFRVIAFDPRGIGQSDSPAGPFSVKQLAGDVAGLLQSLEVRRAHVVGASLGGFVAQEFAVEYPEMTGCLVLCCTSFGGRNHVSPPAEVVLAISAADALDSRERAEKNLGLVFSPHYVNQHPEEIQRIIQLRLSCAVPSISYIRQVQAVVGFDAEARVGQIKSPTLVMTGDQDLMVPPENSRNLAGRIPNARLEIFEGGGHSFFIEQAERFNRVVMEFVLENGTTA